MAFDPAALKRNHNIYEVTATAALIKLDCQKMVEYDQIIEKRLKLVGILLWIGILVAFATFFGAAFLEVSFLLYTVLPLAIVTAIVGGILGHLWKGLNIPDVRYQLVPQLLDTLSRDTEREAPFHIKLGCAPTIRKATLVDTIPHPRRRGWKIDRYQDVWLTLRGTFVDGTEFTLTVTDLAIAAYGWKRSRSGKNKFKRKEKPKGVEVDLTLQVARKRYGALQILQEDVQQAIKLPREARLTRLKMSDRSFTLGLKADPSYGHATDLERLITQLLLNAYHVLNLAKQLSRQSG
ncbi:MAG: hypothetical protein O2890_12765 [Cyanobacteria bacterium]|nr:hypothetical protein [Cyanobacteriota bacterium]MDA0867261.1 hypothetical protein [Cyanobacteriota bacterium]